MVPIRSEFEIQANVPAVVAIADMNAGAMSVTNDADAVVAWLTSKGFLSPGKRLIYRDTDGRWDEIKHDGAGGFTRFAPLGVGTLEEALALVVPK